MPSGPTPGTAADSDHKQVFNDACVLLEFLGRQADNRLQSHFGDTRGDLAAPVHKLASPPCESYKRFLNRLDSIGRRLNDADANRRAARMPTNPPDGLSDEAFLLFSRDFLAAVAAPATVNSIRVTRAYIDARRYSWWRRLGRALRPSRAAPSEAEVENPIAAGARRLAFRVVCAEYVALGLTVCTLLVSAYALAGQRILSSRQQIFDSYDQLGHDIASIANEWPKSQSVRFDLRSLSAACDPANAPAGTTQAAATGATRLAEVVTRVQSDATPGAGIVASTPDTLVEPGLGIRRCTLYWQMKRANENMVAVTMHLVSWIEVPIVRLHLGDAFGIDAAFVGKTADLHTDWCTTLQFTPESDGRHCGSALSDLIYRTPEVADSLLGCIALYVLPTLYGCLGAVAASLRGLRRKVELSLVTMTDRGRLQQDRILGALCGAIMGLFVGYLGKGTTATGLGLSALALLAGYNVSGALAFLDELSKRVFQPAKTEGT